VKKLLALNVRAPARPRVEVILSRNTAETGLRIMNSIQHYGFDITRAAFTAGEHLPTSRRSTRTSSSRRTART
jgi:5'-nucleotidase